MGIFDKKAKGRKPEDFDSPIETVDLDAIASSVYEANTGGEATGAQESALSPANPVSIDQDYGIQEAIALMRTLPADSIELVVRVVKQTLESTHIDIPTIILDATAKEERITNRIGVLKEEITNLEQEIAARSIEISNLEADHQETSMVKERLELAEKLGQRSKPPTQTKLPAPSPRPTGLNAEAKE